MNYTVKDNVSLKKGEEIFLVELLLIDVIDITSWKDSKGLGEKEGEESIQNRANWVNTIMKPRNGVRNFQGTASHTAISP